MTIHAFPKKKVLINRACHVHVIPFLHFHFYTLSLSIYFCSYIQWTQILLKYPKSKPSLNIYKNMQNNFSITERRNHYRISNLYSLKQSGERN